MDFSKQSSSLRSHPSSSPDFQRRSQGITSTERNDENWREHHQEFVEDFQNSEVRRKNFMSMTLSSASKRKILAEKNDADHINSFDVSSRKRPQVQSNMTSDASSDCFEIISGPAKLCSVADESTPLSDNPESVPYDPLTNYTTPRPQFLRYNPDRRRRDIVLRADGELPSLDESGPHSSPCYTPPKHPSLEESFSALCADSKSSFHDEQVEESEDDHEDVDNLEENEEEKESKPSKNTRELVTLLFSLILWGLFIHSLTPGFHPSLRAGGGINKTGLDNFAHCSNIPLGYLMSILMGLSDLCLDTPHSESTCGIEHNGRQLEALQDPSLSIKWPEETPKGKELVTEKDGDPHGDELFTIDLEVVEENMHGVAGLGFVREYNRKFMCYKLGIYYFADQCYENNEAVEVDFADSSVIHYFTSNAFQAAETPLANAEFADGQDDGEKSLHEYDQMEMVSQRNEPTEMGSAELAQTFSILTTYVRGAKFTRGVFFFTSASKHVQLLMLFFFLATVSFSCLYNNRLKYGRASIPFTQTPMPSSASELDVDEHMIRSTVSTEKGNNIITDSDVYQKCLRSPSVNHSSRFSSIKVPVVQCGIKPLEEESIVKAPVVECGIIKPLAVESGIKAPVVELLGEFSITNGRVVSVMGSDGGFKRTEANPEVTPIDQSQRMSERKPMPTCLSGTAEFVSNASTVQKYLRKEDSGVWAEARKPVDAPTPLRRSSRIRNRITSP